MMAPHEKPGIAEAGVVVPPSTASSGNSASSQRLRLLKHLREVGPITTLGARHKLDCLHPAQRLLKLRRLGHRIVASWTWDSMPEGGRHRVARYSLLPRKQLTIEDFLPQKKNPEAAATGSGVKQELESLRDDSVFFGFDQGISLGGGQ